MILFKTIENKKLFWFNNIILSLFFILLVQIIFGFKSYSTINQNNILDNYMLTLTYYYPGDATGSGNTTGSGVTTSQLTVDSNGWYHYQRNGTDYLVVAAATTYCRDSANHCGISSSRGIATSIRYYNYYDTLVLDIGGTSYNAIVLDSCGACMWKDRDTYGEKIDVFVKDSSAVKPGIYNSSISNVTGGNGGTGNAFTNFVTTYTGDITKGYVYNRQNGKALKITPTTLADAIEGKINTIIQDIFKSSKYSTNTGSSYTGIVDSNALNWKQYDSSWGSIHLGSSSLTIREAGCLATSVAIQIKNSGTSISIENFNPGTFVQELSKAGGFTSGGLFRWDGAWKSFAPNWEYYGKDSLPASKNDKISYIKNLLNQGYYPVMCVKRNCGHWVAVTGVTDDNIIIADPGSNSTTVWPTYNAIATDTTLKVAYFKG